MNRISFLLCLALAGATSGAQAAPANHRAAPTVAPKVAPIAKPKPASDDAKWRTPLTGDAKILNAINRLTFGPRPGDVAAVKKLGFGRWIDAQINAGSLDDSALETELSALKLLDESPALLTLAYRGYQGKIRRALEERARVEAGKAPKANAKTTELTAREEQTIQEMKDAGVDITTSLQAMGELTAAKLARATDSKRQLQEVLTDFWGNHFNVDINKQTVFALKLSDDREAIRPHVMGTFRELLGASAHSPAMLIYLDNAKSTVEFTNRRTQKTRGGLNENYGREIMELHTLGVDGGYTQKDVTEVARCFTGWSVDDKGEFIFRARAHDDGEKSVLGHTIPAGGGQKDGEMVLDILASNSATAQHIAFQLCQRFIADEPPTSAVDAVARAFTQSGGDLKTVYRALFDTPEFNSAGAYRAKIKSPLEFAVSAVRALDGSFALPDPDNPRQRLWLMQIGRSARNRNNGDSKLPRRPLATEIAAMGQPLWGYQAPTGYSENSREWVSASALIARLNFALALTTGRIGDVALGKDTFRNASVAQVAGDLLSEPLSAQSLATIQDEIQATPGDGAKLRALILGSPEFQRR